MTPRSPVLTRRDLAVILVLIGLLAVAATAIVAPEFVPISAAPTRTPPAVLPSGAPSGSAPASSYSVPSAPASESPSLPAPRLREGVVGPPGRINPLLATGYADQSLAALLFSGLVRLGPGQTLEADLASEWRAIDGGRTWIFTLRDDARWHDGRPVTASDVVFTVDLLRDPAWPGAGGASWRDVTAHPVNAKTVRFEMATPLGGFLQAATLPILPAHLLRGVPIDRLASDPFNRAPIGSGPFVLASLDDRMAVLLSVEPDPAAAPSPSVPPSASPSAPPTRSPSPSASAASSASAAPVRPIPTGPVPGIEMHFFPDAVALADAYEAGDVDVASGLPPGDAIRLGDLAGSRLLRYPTSTLTSVLFNLRPNHPELRDPIVRTALLRGIDRPGIIADAWHGQATLADAPIPRVSWAFDAKASPTIAFDKAEALSNLGNAGWIPLNGVLSPIQAVKPFSLVLLSPDVATNPSVFLAGSSVAADWEAMGLSVSHVPLPPDELIGEHLRKGAFDAAVVDINVGLDPDLYPLLGSTQSTSQGLNLSGLVDTELDNLLEAARAPGADAARRAAYRALQVRLAERQYLLPIAFRDELVVARDVVVGPEIRQLGELGDRFWDVLSWRLADDR